MHSKIQEDASACLYHSVLNWVSCTTECISPVFFKIFRNDCGPHVLCPAMLMHVLIMVLCRGGKKGSDASVKECRRVECIRKSNEQCCSVCHYSTNGWTVHQEKWIQVQGKDWGHCYIRSNTFLCESSYCLPKKVERAMCLWLEDKKQEGLSSVRLLWGQLHKVWWWVDQYQWE